MTDEELDAMVHQSMDRAIERLQKLHDYAGRPARDQVLREELSRPIKALRAQLAEAKADKEKLGRELNLARYGQPDFSWQVHKEALAEANARANRAEAALAAQIEANAWHSIETAPRDGTWFIARTRLGTTRVVHYADRSDRYPIAHDDKAWPTAPMEWMPISIRNQAHDRSALDRMLAEAREQALRDAADEMEDERAKQAILALIEKP